MLAFPATQFQLIAWLLEVEGLETSDPVMFSSVLTESNLD